LSKHCWASRKKTSALVFFREAQQCF